ncbi:hypothetical protein HRI_000478500 [Hibiscus trionum]|uniref:Uncharacterized protein n=1 Tax=Hibiscus trionum TaxID=183268 RepID=A0A9W7GYZ3_HIBTR|nr:hypothetical protein HRI_000478500 [Hibiscus trionum]
MTRITTKPKLKPNLNQMIKPKITETDPFDTSTTSTMLKSIPSSLESLIGVWSDTPLGKVHCDKRPNFSTQSHRPKIDPNYYICFWPQTT